jgi:hypothetical protein
MRPSSLGALGTLARVSTEIADKDGVRARWDLKRRLIRAYMDWLKTWPGVATQEGGRMFKRDGMVLRAVPRKEER